ncbi:MAG: DNA double-strand break repair nuclease NurA [Candidatus Bathyarchaeia archaeon]
MTEPETLVKLVEDAQTKGEKAQKDMNRLKKLSSGLTDFFEKEKLLLKEDVFESVELGYESTVGIDGSFQLVGGIGGKWYAPVSVARVIFPGGPESKPKVDIFWAGIEEIQEGDFKPEQDASVMMLTGESKAILNWGVSDNKAIVFIDGPIVDPPWCSDSSYIKFRCNALKKCLQKSLVIGCVKRSRDRFYIKNLIDSKKEKQKTLDNFPSDQHLMAYVFANMRYRGYHGPIFAKWIDISDAKVNKLYKQNGVYIFCFFFQKSASSQVLRLDIPFSKGPEITAIIDAKIIEAAKAVNDWTYPGQDYPVPVFLAHEKCNIREGCAEVLYDEIMTRSKSTDPLNQTISLQLR